MIGVIFRQQPRVALALEGRMIAEQQVAEKAEVLLLAFDHGGLQLHEPVIDVVELQRTVCPHTFDLVNNDAVELGYVVEPGVHAQLITQFVTDCLIESRHRPRHRNAVTARLDVGVSCQAVARHALKVEFKRVDVRLVRKILPIEVG